MKREHMEFDDETMFKALRQHAFEEFDAYVEAFCENGCEQGNGGDSILDVSREDVECILDNYIDTFDERGSGARDEWMRNAVQSVTGLVR